jgi:uncharacterized protein
MPGDVPRVSFRVETTFSIKPELECDSGPGRSVLVGRNSADSSLDGVYLGKAAETPFKDVWLDTRGAHAIYVMGKRRSGKSFTLGALAEGLVASGWVRQSDDPKAVLILDTMNVFLTMPYRIDDAGRPSAVADVRRWQLVPENIPVDLMAPAGSAIPEEVVATPITLRPSDLAVDEWCGLFDADPFSDPLGHVITEVHAKVSADGYHDGETGNDIPPNQAFDIDDLLRALETDGDLQRYHRDTRESLRRRLLAARRSPIFSSSGLDVRDLLVPGRICVLLLRELDLQMRAVLVGLIVKRIMALRGESEQYERLVEVHQARADNLADVDSERAAIEQGLADDARQRVRSGIPRSWLIIDEAHNYVPASGALASRQPLRRYVTEGRNLGLSIVVATQQPSGLDPAIQRNADVLIVHSLSHTPDIEAAQGMLNSAVPTEVTIGGTRRITTGGRIFESTVRALPPGYALVSTDRANRLFPVRVRPRLTVHGGGDY